MTKKQTFKYQDKECFFCGTKETLDAHRLIPGKEGGKYTRWNTITTCCNCHRKCHLGIIKVIGKYQTTAGPKINYIENKIEKWK